LSTGDYTGKEIFVPNGAEEKEPEPPARSFADGFLRNTRQHMGFSLSVFELYTPDVRLSSGETKDVSFTSILPQLYLNFEKKKLDFRLTYGAAYRRFNNGGSDLNNRVSHNGAAEFSYSLFARQKTNLQLSSALTSAYYDAASSFLDWSSYAPYQYDGAAQIYLDNRRQTRYRAALNLDYRFAKKASLNSTLGYDVALYSGSDIPTAGVLYASVAGSFQLKRWLCFNTRYSQSVNQGFSGDNIQSLQFGGFSFKLGRRWVITSLGGIDTTKAGGARWTTGSGDVSVSKTSRRTSIAFSYHRGYSKVFPDSRVRLGDTATIDAVQSLSRRVSVYVNASYARGSTLLTSSLADTLYGGGGIDIALRNNLVVSMNYVLTSQKLMNVSLPDSSLHRHTATVGLNYFLPSFRERMTSRPRR